MGSVDGFELQRSEQHSAAGQQQKPACIGNGAVSEKDDGGKSDGPDPDPHQLFVEKGGPLH